MKDIFRILVVGYLVRKFLAPKVYPVFDEVIEQLPTVPTAPTVTPPKVEVPRVREEVLLVDKGQLIVDDNLIYDEVSYPRRRT